MGTDEGRTVSIHAPARGATPHSRDLTPASLVSIHAPARGATAHQTYRRIIADGFNPRPCARGDRTSIVQSCDSPSFNPRPCARGDRNVQINYSHDRVSIHAPARGATPLSLLAWTGRIKFQSTPLREGRPQPDLVPGCQ